MKQFTINIIKIDKPHSTNFRSQTIKLITNHETITKCAFNMKIRYKSNR